MDREQVIIIGSGPAGYTAALYAARARLSPLLIEGYAWGGLLQQTNKVENYPGFSQGILGPELMQNMREQAQAFGARLLSDQVSRILLSEDGGLHHIWVGEQEYQSKVVILAMGAEHKQLGVKGELEHAGRGISYCATCDAAFFNEATTLVIGGGDSAMEEAIFLSKFAKEVTIVHRRNQWRASKIMLERASQYQNIELLAPYRVLEFSSAGPGQLGYATLENIDDGSQEIRTIDGAFIAIGHQPQSSLVKEQIQTDEQGYVRVAGRSTKTNLAGVFAAGDLIDSTYRQAITAAASGAEAALDAERYLRDN